MPFDALMPCLGKSLDYLSRATFSLSVDLNVRLPEQRLSVNSAGAASGLIGSLVRIKLRRWIDWAFLTTHSTSSRACLKSLPSVGFYGTTCGLSRSFVSQFYNFSFNYLILYMAFLGRGLRPASMAPGEILWLGLLLLIGNLRGDRSFAPFSPRYQIPFDLEGCGDV
jgi:hypothetical protein